MPRCLLHLSLIACALVSSRALATEAQPQSLTFRNNVMAAISKAGCNLGTCHGNASGKGGFKLSLRGQDAAFDYAALALDADGRRIDSFAPEQSLILQKATNKLAHEGGKRFDSQSWEYATLRDWIARGVAAPNKDDVLLTKLEVTPRTAILEAGTNQVQLTAYAVFSDGTERDVSPYAVYEPLQNGLVEVSRSGLVKRLKFGEPTVLVRYLGQSVPVRLMFVEDRPDFIWGKPRRNNYIDSAIFTKLKALRMNPSGLCSDEVFIRRAHLDLLGQPPTADEARAFVMDEHADKRPRIIDALLARNEFTDYWTMKWADVLKVESRTLDETGMKAFHAWIRESVRSNRPIDAMVRDLIATCGSTYHEPASNFYRANRTPVERSVSAAQVFLGTRLQCAQCHNHPFDKWTQDDYYSWASVFSRIDYKLIGDKRSDKNDKHEFIGEQIVFLKDKGELENPRTGDAAKPRFLGANMHALAKAEDELQATAKWLTSAANPLFAKAQANRIWYHLMGRGLVDPVDDIRLTNPASHPELLDALAKDIANSGFDLRHLIRTIMLSRTYQLDNKPNATNTADLTNYSHTLPRRLTAEQLYDGIHLALGVLPQLSGLPLGTRAAQKPGPINGKTGRKGDPNSPETFLAQFGKPARQIVCECERTSSTSLSSTFQFISGPLVNTLVGDKHNILRDIAKSDASADDMVATLYWRILGRAPSKLENEHMTAWINSLKDDKRAALQDIAWGLVNAKEFILRP